MKYYVCMYVCVHIHVWMYIFQNAWYLPQWNLNTAKGQGTGQGFVISGCFSISIFRYYWSEEYHLMHQGHVNRSTLYFCGLEKVIVMVTKQITCRKITSSVFLQNAMYLTVNNLVGGSDYSYFNLNTIYLVLIDAYLTTGKVLYFSLTKHSKSSNHSSALHGNQLKSWWKNLTQTRKYLHLSLVACQTISLGNHKQGTRVPN